jgi:hypothetical protein
MILQALAAALLACGSVHESLAVDRIVLKVEAISLPAATASGVQLSLDLTAGPAVRARVEKLDVTQPPQLGRTLGSFSDVDIACTDLLVKEPQFACRSASVTARGGPLGSLSMTAAGGYETASRTLSVSGSGVALAEGRAQFASKLGPKEWSLDADARSLDLNAARKLAAPWVHLPDAYTFSGRVDTRIQVAGRKDSLQLRMAAHTADLSLTNKEGTVVAEKVAASLSGTAVRKRDGVTLDAELGSSAGEALAGPVLLNFATNPLVLHARGSTDGAQTLEIAEVTVSQKDLMQASGQGRVTLGDQPAVARANVTIQSLEFPAAYRSFLQLAFATTDFGALATTGNATGVIEIADNSIERLDARLDNIEIKDPKNQFSMADMTGEIHWGAETKADVAPSHLSWSRSRTYGLSGGAARVDFTARDRNFSLLGDTRFPIFDGALVVHTLAARKLGAADAELDFDAEIEPISMPLLSKAFGWPELSGLLAGRIPSVTYRNHMLAVDGDLIAKVFDGTIVGSRFRLRDPLGPWPRVFADVTARGLDLALVTHTFSIGSITGRLDGDINGIELFNWSPVAFDAKLYSTPGDRSKHLISQKAVTSISSIGGGGGGVTAALQSGVLRFFDTFRYDRIGISCQLRGEVCLMAGIEPARTGYYMVKGSGLPRIDIIGNAGRVDWPQLVGQIVAGMHSQNVIVR